MGRKTGQFLTLHLATSIVHRMARPLRLKFPGALYHLTARGNVQHAILVDDWDRQHFVRLLGREMQQQQWRCYVYCLMGNHYHLVIETPEPNLSRGLKRLHGEQRGRESFLKATNAKVRWRQAITPVW
jgi:REP element-mobilizing transposase RayT